MVRQLRRLVLGLLLGAAVGWFWQRRQQRAEMVGEPTMSEPQADDRIVLPAWTPAALHGEDSPVAGRIVLPEGADSPPPSTGGESLGERLVVGGNGAEPAAPSGEGGEEAVAEAAPTGNGDLTPSASAAEGTQDVDAAASAGFEGAEGTGAAIEGYCVRCKEQRAMVNVHPYTTANKRPALKGECAVCGAGMFKFTKE